MSVLSFLDCLDDILKQFAIVGSLKEQQVQSTKEHKDLSWETLVGEKTQQDFLNTELNQVQ